MSDPPHPDSTPTLIDADLLRSWPLPAPDVTGDKSARGVVVCIGGAPEMPGAIILAGTAALRAGAGTLRLGVPESIRLAVGVAVPEALVFGLPETADGGLASAGADRIGHRTAHADAVLIGPGMVDADAAPNLLEAVLCRLDAPGVVVLDALALDGAARAVQAVRDCRLAAILTPHTGELARMLDMDRDSVEAEPLATARRAAATFGAVVTAKSAQTLVVAPDGRAYEYREGNVGLATSGSGDTLAGIVAGLAARGAEPVQAAVWGVYLHGAAGNRLHASMGRIGFLARELLAQVPRLMAEFDSDVVAAVRPP